MQKRSYRGDCRYGKGIEPVGKLSLQRTPLLEAQGWADKPASRPLSHRLGAVANKPAKMRCGLFSKAVKGVLASRRDTGAVGDAREPWADS